MGACAVPGMMDEEVGVITAGLGDRLAAVCRYGPKRSEKGESGSAAQRTWRRSGQLALLACFAAL